MTLLKAQASELLTMLENGTRIDRAEVIDFVRAVKNFIPETAQVSDTHTDTSQFTRKESTPVRMVASNWNLTKCKRCLEQGAPDGSIIVRIFGVGWWHDDCYRLVNPDFYKGL